MKKQQMKNGLDTYNDGWKKLKKLRKDKNSNKEFEFDILMANPPFAGDIKESRILAKYELGKNLTVNIKIQLVEIFCLLNVILTF
jgi:type I restriction enzyme M protein